MMSKEAKKNYVEEMKKNFTSNESVMIAQYQGLNVNELDELRKQLREKGILFKITKNRITKIAIKETSKKCSEKNDNDFIKIANNLNAAIVEVEICTKKLLEWTKENKLRSVLFSASDYLELLGITAGSHYLSRGALSEKNTNNKSLSARKDLALFFSTQILLVKFLRYQQKV